MNLPTRQRAIAQNIARALVDGFDKHYRLFRECSALAKDRFENGEWLAVQKAVGERIRFYDDRVAEAVARLHSEFHADSLGDEVWQQAKLYYIGLLTNHRQPECAETFFNSVFCRILHRTYFHNDFIFLRPAVSTEYIEANPPTYRSYYPNEAGFPESLRQVLLDFGWRRPFEDIDRDVGYLHRAIADHVGKWPALELNFQIQILSSAFYRNKAAYIIGKAVNGSTEYPFAIPILHTPSGKLCADTILLDSRSFGILFSLSRAYFMVDMEVPSAYVRFLRSMVPEKPRSELYSMLGLGKQGKNEFFRDLIHHLAHSQDHFVIAPGIRGLVMLVFTLPSYPYVFKLIRDIFGPSKDTDRASVKRKYQWVKQIDRVGRMADTLEFSDVALPKARFSEEVLQELYQFAPSIVEQDDDELVIKHLYIERRMEPLNIYLAKAERMGQQTRVEQAVVDYGNAIRELAIANIFPGDLLWKNFGVTRYGRVVFYDYDEIEPMTECRFRKIPDAPHPEMEMADEPWYAVAQNDIFPEEFEKFILTSASIKETFMRRHADLLDARFWLDTQTDIRQGAIKDFFPYPESLRFCNLYSQAVPPAVAP